MRRKLNQVRSVADTFEQLDAINMNDRELARARAVLARVEYIAALMARAGRAVAGLIRALIIRPYRLAEVGASDRGLSAAAAPRSLCRRVE